MKPLVWVDTSFLYALFVQCDKNHNKANRTWRHYVEQRLTFATSNLVISELGTLLAYRYGHKIALKQIVGIQDSSLLNKVYSDPNMDTGALDWWRKFSDQKFSFVDCVSFEFMRKLGIKKALAFDKDYIIAGFNVGN